MKFFRGKSNGNNKANLAVVLIVAIGVTGLAKTSFPIACCLTPSWPRMSYRSFVSTTFSVENDFSRKSHSALNVQIGHRQGIFADEVAARFNKIAHQLGENVIGIINLGNAHA